MDNNNVMKPLHAENTSLCLSWFYVSQILISIVSVKFELAANVCECGRDNSCNKFRSYICAAHSRVGKGGIYRRQFCRHVAFPRRNEPCKLKSIFSIRHSMIEFSNLCALPGSRSVPLSHTYIKIFILTRFGLVIELIDKYAIYTIFA